MEQQQQQQEVAMSLVPPEVLRTCIWNLLDTKDLQNFRNVCKGWRDAANQLVSTCNLDLPLTAECCNALARLHPHCPGITQLSVVMDDQDAHGDVTAYLGHLAQYVQQVPEVLHRVVTAYLAFSPFLVVDALASLLANGLPNLTELEVVSGWYGAALAVSTFAAACPKLSSVSIDATGYQRQDGNYCELLAEHLAGLTGITSLQLYGSVGWTTMSPSWPYGGLSHVLKQLKKLDSVVIVGAPADLVREVVQLTHLGVRFGSKQVHMQPVSSLQCITALTNLVELDIQDQPGWLDDADFSVLARHQVNLRTLTVRRINLTLNSHQQIPHLATVSMVSFTPKTVCNLLPLLPNVKTVSGRMVFSASDSNIREGSHWFMLPNFSIDSSESDEEDDEGDSVGQVAVNASSSENIPNQYFAVRHDPNWQANHLTAEAPYLQRAVQLLSAVTWSGQLVVGGLNSRDMPTPSEATTSLEELHRVLQQATVHQPLTGVRQLFVYKFASSRFPRKVKADSLLHTICHAFPDLQLLSIEGRPDNTVAGLQRLAMPPELRHCQIRYGVFGPPRAEAKDCCLALAMAMKVPVVRLYQGMCTEDAMKEWVVAQAAAVGKRVVFCPWVTYKSF